MSCPAEFAGSSEAAFTRWSVRAMARPKETAPMKEMLKARAMGVAAPRTRFVAVAVVLAAVGACSTRVGDNNQVTPRAVLTVIGEKPTSAAGADPVTVSVRSGSDVLLSAKDSDGIDSALTSFQFTQTAGPTLPALPDPGGLLVRTANSASFRAPVVQQDTVFGFRLTVTNSRGATGTANVSVTVKPAGDPNQFLQPDIIDSPLPNHLTLAVATLEGLSGLSADVPSCVRVARTVQYNSRDGAPRTLVLPQLATLQANAVWTKDVGGAAASNLANAVASHTNPRVV